MKAIMLLTGGGAMVILTSFPSATDVGLLKKLEYKGIDKFIAYNIPLDLAKQRYGTHFAVVAGDLHETDDLRVLDYNDARAFKLFHFAELGQPTVYEGEGGYEGVGTAVRGADDLQ